MECHLNSINNVTFLCGNHRLLLLDDVRMGSVDDGDPNTTNIYLGNLPTKVSVHFIYFMLQSIYSLKKQSMCKKS